MIQKLVIENFKSIRNLQLDCKKVNVFIGEPNAGKTNIIEALALYSARDYGLKSYVRYKDLTDLFFDNQIDLEILIAVNGEKLQIKFNNNSHRFRFNYIDKNGTPLHSSDVSITGENFQPINSNIRYYKFNGELNLNDPIPGKLSVPFGNNLVSILISDTNFRRLISEIFKEKGFRLNIKPVEKELMISKEVGDDIFSYGYSNISETLKRIVFLMACLETNKDSVLLFDEPEANMFPFYTTYFAERIAKDETNQYFFTTHNSYLVNTLIAKVGVKDLNVCLTYMEDYQTKIHVMTESELDELVNSGIDLTFNIDHFLEKE